MRISAVIPLLDEEPTLNELHARLGAVLKELSPDDYEIIFANDATFCFLGVEPTTDVLGKRPGEVNER